MAAETNVSQLNSIEITKFNEQLGSEWASESMSLHTLDMALDGDDYITVCRKLLVFLQLLV